MQNLYRAIVFFDLDGTLLTSSKQVAPSSLRGIQELKKNHILPVICTGRNIFLVHDLMSKIKVQSAICGNGNYIVYQNKPIFKSHIKQRLVLKLLKMANKFHDPITFQTHNQVVLNYSNHLTRLEYQHKHHTNPPVNPNFYKNHYLVGCNIFTLHHDKDYQKAFKNQLSIVRNSDLCLDVQDAGISKGTGVKTILKYLHAPHLPTYAFGDGRNDIPMLKTVDHGISMRNGWDSVRASAQYITDDNDHGGIITGLRHYHLV